MIQWFVCLFKKGMDEYTENQQQKKKMFRNIRKSNNQEGKIKMNYTQAVALAKAGKEEGFQFLYESTYKNKYYLALKYLKDEQAAQDILQDAYIKAFDKLDTLQNPETFPAWFGVIVGNLAKNRLQKKIRYCFLTSQSTMKKSLLNMKSKTKRSTISRSFPTANVKPSSWYTK